MSQNEIARSGIELEVLAAVLYIARLTPDWSQRPYWMLRRCVIPYATARQFLILRRDGLPVAFAGWVVEEPGKPAPWREDRYLPSVPEIIGARTQSGVCLVTELIVAPFVGTQRVLNEVARSLGVAEAPGWIEWDGERRMAAVHAGSQQED